MRNAADDTVITTAKWKNIRAGFKSFTLPLLTKKYAAVATKAEINPAVIKN